MNKPEEHHIKDAMEKQFKICGAFMEKLENRLDMVLKIATANRNASERIESYMNGTVKFNHLGKKEKGALVIAIITAISSVLAQLVVAVI